MWKTWVHLAFFLALAILFQSLRFLIPLPGLVNMFLIGSLLNLVMVLSVWQTDSLKAVLIGIVLPLGAFVQGQLPLLPMVPVVAAGNAVYMTWAWFWQQKRVVFAAPLFKAAVLYGGTLFVIHLIGIPAPLADMLSLMMSWPQIITGCAGIILAEIIQRRLQPDIRVKRQNRGAR